MMTDEQFNQKVEELLKDYKGQVDHFYEAVGMVSVGRLVGWRVMRLVASRRCWELSCQLFGDLKKELPERGRYAHKSVGLKIVDKLGGYWDVVRGEKSFRMSQDRRSLE
jgi:hypothetical protein